MEGGFIDSINYSDPSGIDPESKEQIINVTLNSIDEFETSEENFIYQFDVVVFGFWDYSGGFSISTEKSKGIVEKYIKNGYGFVAGHDSIILEFLEDGEPIGLTAIRDLFGIGIHQKEGSFESAQSSEVEVHKEVLLLNYPWNLETSSKQQIYFSNTAKQNDTGDIWYWFSDSTSQISESENFYLTTYGNTAMIQTGHSDCSATEFERKVLGNTIFYLKQRTTEHEFEEHLNSHDKARPVISNITIDLINYLVIIEAYDVGTLYTFKVVSYNSEGKEIDNSEADVNVTTGIKYYKYLFSENSKCDVETMVNTAYNNTIKFTTEDVVYQRYLHVAPVDKADNMGKIFRIRLNFSTNTFSQSNTFTRSNTFTNSNTFMP
ncbi:Ig domain-containing protein [Histomonas meleagridis]|uniref:Ig domain-containing protein n=1 Tax=Histomonas meleagridis TaxID=135588 RepID=UPI00355A1659|nr:Ig domain-containing protein [Histomonas meleagridis]KAH0805047.1 Ig domain-containing protein [Histomonas meleagridis]